MAIEANQAFNVYNFRNVVGDPARPYLFLVHIPEIGTDTVVTAMARTTTLPEKTIQDVSVPFQGVNLKLGSTPTYQDWSVTFLCDEAHELRRLFLKWNSLIYDVGTGFVGHSNTYKSDKMGVAQLGRRGEQVARYGFVGAYPKDIGSIQVDHGKATEAETFEVKFSYDYWIYVSQFGEQTTSGPEVRPTSATKLSRGSPPPAGQWSNFKPQ